MVSFFSNPGGGKLRKTRSGDRRFSLTGSGAVRAAREFSDPDPIGRDRRAVRLDSAGCSPRENPHRRTGRTPAPEPPAPKREPFLRRSPPGQDRSARHARQRQIRSEPFHRWSSALPPCSRNGSGGISPRGQRSGTARPYTMRSASSASRRPTSRFSGG